MANPEKALRQEQRRIDQRHIYKQEALLSLARQLVRMGRIVEAALCVLKADKYCSHRDALRAEWRQLLRQACPPRNAVDIRLHWRRAAKHAVRILCDPDPREVAHHVHQSIGHFFSGVGLSSECTGDEVALVLVSCLLRDVANGYTYQVATKLTLVDGREPAVRLFAKAISWRGGTSGQFQVIAGGRYRAR